VRPLPTPRPDRSGKQIAPVSFEVGAIFFRVFAF
jgi:hypothetical protein